MENSEAVIQSIGIVGGGKIGLELFDLFSSSDLTRVVYVVDKDLQAPAILAAKKANINTFTEIDQALKKDADFILEVTGSEKVVEYLSHKLENVHGKLITHKMAFVILKVIESNNQRARSIVSSEVVEIKTEIDKNLETIANLVNDIEGVTSEMRILALNARIEAARVGEDGRGFSVVAEQMGESVNSIRDISKQIENMSETIQTTSDRISLSVNKLK